MINKINTLLSYIKTLCEADIERIISFVPDIVSVNQQLPDRPSCPYCKDSNVIKYGHTKGKQRFFCHGCGKTFLYSTVTLMYNSHFSRSVWAGLIRDTLTDETLDDSAEKFGFSHQTAFNMRHKVSVPMCQQPGRFIVQFTVQYRKRQLLAWREGYQGLQPCNNLRLYQHIY